MAIAELKARLDEKRKRARAIVDGAEADDRNLTEEERTEFDTLEAEIRDLADRVERMERTRPTAGPGRENVNADERPPAEARDHAAEERMNEETHALALQAWCAYRVGDTLSERHRVACERANANPAASTFSIDLTRSRSALRDIQRRALHPDIGSDGGFMRPEGFVPMLELALLQFGGLRQRADIMRTDTAADMPWPGANDTGNKGRLIASGSAAANVQPAINRHILKAHAYTSEMIRVSRRLIRDTPINLAEALALMLGERLGRITAEHFISGDGIGKPTGISVSAATGVTSAATGAIAASELSSLITSVDPAYRMGASVGFLCSDSVRAYLGELQDGVGRYLFRTADGGPPERIFGYPVFVDQEMPAFSALASGSKSVLFGDFSAYKIRDVGSVRLGRLEERFGEYDEVAWVAFSEHDGLLLNPGTAALSPVKALVQV